MRLANVRGRGVILTGGSSGADVHKASDGAFGPDLPSIYRDWEAFRAWAASIELGADVTFEVEDLQAPSPAPPQVFAIGLNYEEHARETGFDAPTDLPPVFAKFASSLTGPTGEIDLPEGNVDWEVEVVAVIGRAAHRVSAEHAWDHVAGLTVGQDLSERVRQFQGQAPQFGLAKSFPKFSPTGPWLVSPDELENRDDLALGCSIDGEVMQDGRTSNLLVDIPHGIAALSEVVTLLPGDLIFTGTPDGVGLGLVPARFLRSGETLHSWVEGIGTMTHTFR